MAKDTYYMKLEYFKKYRNSRNRYIKICKMNSKKKSEEILLFMMLEKIEI